MKTLLVLLGIAGTIGAVMFIPNEYTAESNIEKEIVIKVERVDTLEDRIKMAQEAEMSQIEASAQTAYDSVMEEKLNEVADGVKAQYIAEIEATITSEDY